MRKKRYFVSAVTLASTLFLALQARAQEVSAVSVPDAVSQRESLSENVEPIPQKNASEEVNSGDAMLMDAITVTATRQEEKLLRVPQTINVITRETMDDHNVNNVEEMLRHTPGVHVTRNVSAGNSPFGELGSITMRGVGGNRILMTVDGDRALEQQGGTGNVGNRMFIDTQMLKSVEVRRGPASTLFGADAMGGMVAYETLDPSDILKGRAFGSKAMVGWDGVNYGKTEHGAVAFQLNDELSAMVGVTHRTHDETRLRRAKNIAGVRPGNLKTSELPESRFETQNYLGKAVWRPNADHQVKLTGEFFKMNTSTDNHMGSISGMGGTRYVVLQGYDHRYQDQERWRVGVDHKWDVGAAWLDQLKWRVSYSNQDRETTRDQNYRTTPTGTPTNLKRIDDYEQEMYSGDFQLTSSFDALNTKHTLTYGFQGDYTKLTYDFKSTNRRTGVTTTTSAVPTFVNSDTIRADLYIQDEIKLFDDYLTVTPGVRRAYYSVDPSGGVSYNKMSEDRWLPQVGAVLDLTNVYSVYARYARGFKMPTASQLYVSYSFPAIPYYYDPNPNLKPETSDTYEIGFRGKYDKAWFSIGGFYTDYDDFIDGGQPVVGTSDHYHADNIDGLKIYGIEASGEWQFLKNWSVSGSVDWQRAKQKDKLGYQPWLVPPLTTTVGLKWKVPEYRVTTELFGTFSRKLHRAEERDDEGNKFDRFKPGSYALFDGYVNWQMSKNLKLSVSVTNILNKRYFNYIAATYNKAEYNNPINPLELYTGTGRTFAASLHVDF